MCNLRSDYVGTEGTTALMGSGLPGHSESGVGQCTGPLLRKPDQAALEDGPTIKVCGQGTGLRHQHRWELTEIERGDVQDIPGGTGSDDRVGWLWTGLGKPIRFSTKLSFLLHIMRD